MYTLFVVTEKIGSPLKERFTVYNFGIITL